MSKFKSINTNYNFVFLYVINHIILALFSHHQSEKYFHSEVVHLGNVDVHLGEELVQMLGVVVPEDVLGHAAVLDTLNHRSMVAGIRENLAPYS